MPSVKGLSYADIAKRTSKSALGVPSATSCFPDRPSYDPETSRELARTFLPNAVEFNFQGLGDARAYLPALHQRYGDQVISVRRMANDRVQLGFAPGVDLVKVVFDGFTFGSATIPTRRTYTPNENILCVTVANLAVAGPDATVKALRKHFQQYGPIADIRLHYLGSTNWLLPSAAVYLDMTDCPDLANKLDRCPILLGQRATLRWRNAPPLCVYCKRAGHAVSACAALQRKKARSKPESAPTTAARGRKRARVASPASSGERAAASAPPPPPSPPPPRAVSPAPSSHSSTSSAAEPAPTVPAAEAPAPPAAKDSQAAVLRPRRSQRKLASTSEKASKGAPGGRNVYSALWEGASDDSNPSEPKPSWSDMAMDGGGEDGDGGQLGGSED